MNKKSTLSELRVLGRALVRELGVVENATSRNDISLSQAHILVEIERRRLLTAKDLSQDLLIDKALVSRIVSQLCEQKLVRVQDDATDKRRKHLSLTKLGQQKVDIIHYEADARIQQAIDRLSVSDRQKVVLGLSLYVDALHRSRVEAESK